MDYATLTADQWSTLTADQWAVLQLDNALVAIAPAATPATVTGTTSTLAANLTTGDAPFTYAWTWTTKPTGSTPTFSNSAVANPTATFNRVGNYVATLTTTDSNGDSATGTASITVTATASAVVVSPASVTLAELATQQFTAAVSDQFGQAIGGPPLTWTIETPAATVNGTGLVTQAGRIVRATSGSVSGTATVLSVVRATDALGNALATSSALSEQGAAVLGAIEDASFTPLPAGAYPVTLTLTNATGGQPITNATIRYTQAGVTKQVTTTNSAGVYVTSIDAGSYLRTISAPGFSGLASAVTIAGTASIPVALTQLAITAPSDPGYCVCLLNSATPINATAGNAVISLQVTFAPNRQIPVAVEQLTTDANGAATVELPRGWKYRASVNGGRPVQFTVPDTDSFVVPGLLGPDELCRED